MSARVALATPNPERDRLPALLFAALFDPLFDAHRRAADLAATTSPRPGG